jgi:hypothetical protein
MSVDSENEKILQEFMDVLDNEGEDEIKNHPPMMAKPQAQPHPAPQRTQAPQFAKQPSQPPPAQSHQQQQNSSFQQASNYQQQQQQYAQQQYAQQQPASSRQIQTNTEYQQPAYNSQNNITNLSGQGQVQTARQGNNNSHSNNNNNNGNSNNNNNSNSNVNNVSSQSMGRGKSDIKEPPQMDMWRESADLQNRVKNAIEKSMSVIKKFKAIKDNSQL